MLGTGLSLSSLRESTIPSTTSSSSTLGTYCRHMGSSGERIRSTIAGLIRNSKFSAAWRSRSSSGKCSGPNLAASVSREEIEFFLRTSCQVSMDQPPRSSLVQRLHVHHLVVAGSVEIRDHRGLAVAPGLVKLTGGVIVGASGGLHDDQPTHP